ncbi:MAG: hypothetical protein ACRDLL_16710 [Solirubrobacterales bacterium]
MKRVPKFKLGEDVAFDYEPTGWTKGTIFRIDNFSEGISYHVRVTRDGGQGEATFILGEDSLDRLCPFVLDDCKAKFDNVDLNFGGATHYGISHFDRARETLRKYQRSDTAVMLLAVVDLLEAIQ